MNKMKSKISKKIIFQLKGHSYSNLQNSITSDDVSFVSLASNDTDKLLQAADSSQARMTVEGPTSSIDTASKYIKPCDAIESTEFKKQKGCIQNAEFKESNGTFSVINTKKNDVSKRFFRLYWKPKTARPLKKLKDESVALSDKEAPRCAQNKTSTRQKCRRYGVGESEMKNDINKLYHMFLEKSMEECNL